jgi:hypothetical protein
VPPRLQARARFALGEFLLLDGPPPGCPACWLRPDQPVAGEDVLSGLLIARPPAAAVAAGSGEAPSTVPTVLHATSSA